MRQRAFLLAALLAGPLLAAPPTERERLAARIGAMEARFDAEEARCSDRFAVNACIDAVRQRRRAALTELRGRELELDDAERRARAVQRQREIDARQAGALASAPPMRPAPAAMPASAAAPAVDRRAEPAAEREARFAAERKARNAAEARAAAQRAAAAERRRAAAAADRARIAEREARRAASGRRSAPLPPPPGLAASAPPR